VRLVAGLVGVLLVEVEEPRVLRRAMRLVEEAARLGARRPGQLADDLGDARLQPSLARQRADTT
jgi:hypothetical protein